MMLLVGGVGVAAVLGAAALLGVVALERHVGYFAPVWDPDGRNVYVLERATRGAVWGFGWESLTPPAYTYVLDDRLALLKLDSETGEVTTLATFEGSPVSGRVTRHYRGRIFNPLSALVEPRGKAIAVGARMSVPREPRSEQWSLTCLWLPDRAPIAEWSRFWHGEISPSEAALDHDVEVLTTPGTEAFPSAVVAVDATGAMKVLIHNDEFESLYPDGVPVAVVAENSRRTSIERARDFRYVESRFVERFLAEGMSEAQAKIAAIDSMEEHGYLPKSPRLVATPVKVLPPDVRMFDISENHLRVGLFQDIGSALATPGSEVQTGTGTYLKYGDDELGPQLRAWREAGNDRFGVRYRGRLYLLEVRRFDRGR